MDMVRHCISVRICIYGSLTHQPFRKPLCRFRYQHRNSNRFTDPYCAGYTYPSQHDEGQKERKGMRRLRRRLSSSSRSPSTPAAAIYGRSTDIPRSPPGSATDTSSSTACPDSTAASTSRLTPAPRSTLALPARSCAASSTTAGATTCSSTTATDSARSTLT